MQKEMKSMKEFDVYEEVPIEQCSQEDIDSALDCKWVKRWKTANTVRCRLTARGCFQENMDQDTVRKYTYIGDTQSTTTCYDVV